MKPIPAPEELKPALYPGERVLWIGQPEASAIFAAADRYTIPSTFLIAAFIILAGMVMGFFLVLGGAGGRSVSGIEALNFYSALIFFFVVVPAFGIYLAFGRFLLKILKKKFTLYALTEKRAIIVTRFLGRNFNSAFLKIAPEITLSLHRGDIGTIHFGPGPGLIGRLENVGIEFPNSPYGSYTPAFFDIKNAKQVHELALKLAAGGETPVQKAE